MQHEFSQTSDYFSLEDWRLFFSFLEKNLLRIDKIPLRRRFENLFVSIKFNVISLFCENIRDTWRFWWDNSVCLVLIIGLYHDSFPYVGADVMCIHAPRWIYNLFWLHLSFSDNFSSLFLSLFLLRRIFFNFFPTHLAKCWKLCFLCFDLFS